MAKDDDDQNDADPFETPARVAKAKEATVVSTEPLKLEPQLVDDQESPNNAEGLVSPGQTSADVPVLGRSAGRLEKPFTHGESLSFYHSPRQYTLGRKDFSKSDDDAPDIVFMLRSSPEIIECDISDDESGLEDRDQYDAVYSIPCKDSKINELVSAMASLSLGTALTVARPTITPTRIRALMSPSVPVPVRTPVSSPVAVSHLAVVTLPTTTQHTIAMEVDVDIVHPKVGMNGALRPHGMSEAAPMDGVVFHPEANDMEMADTFATNRKLLKVAI